MTGKMGCEKMEWHEEWVNEFIKRGGTKQMANSKSVAIFRDIVAGTGDKFTTAAVADAETERANSELYRAKLDLDRLKSQAELSTRELEIQLAEKRRLVYSELETKQKYLDSFFEALKNCETAEGRDAMRRAQTFVNSVTLNTVYDNTAFIVGLASILSNGEIGAIEEFKKIDPKLFDDEAEWGKKRIKNKRLW